MSVILAKNKIKLVIENGGEVYKGSRFDWNGTIVSFQFDGIELLGEEKKAGDRNPSIFGRGMHNEFGIHNCIGYDDVDSDGFFPKIGIGSLKKNSKPYFFYTQYVVEPAEFKYQFSGDKNEPDSVAFFCTMKERNGYGYEYVKTISIKDNSVVIKYEIHNTGVKPLSTDEYVHNFINPGHNGVNKGLFVELSAPVSSQSFAKKVDPDGVLSAEKNKLVFTKNPSKKNEFYMGDITNCADKSNKSDVSDKSWWSVFDPISGLKITEQGDFDAEKIDLWGHNEDISPELFKKFSIESGKSAFWTRIITVEK